MPCRASGRGVRQGWRSWNCYGADITDTRMREVGEHGTHELVGVAVTPCDVVMNMEVTRLTLLAASTR